MHTHKDSRRRAPRPQREHRSIVDIDPEDPSQLLDDAGQFSIETFDLEAQPVAEAEADLEAAAIVTSADEGESESEVDEDARELDTPSETTADAYVAAAEDSGDLYGVHTPHAPESDPDQTEDHESFVASEAGEHWLETLGKSAAEYGVVPEAVIDVTDDSDEHVEHRGHHSSDTRDRPVADKGSGGNSGL